VQTHLRSADWSRAHELRGRELVLEGLQVERCLNCKSLRLLPPATAQLVDKLFTLLAITTPASTAAKASAARTRPFPPPSAAAPPTPPVAPSDAVPVVAWTARPARRKLEDVILAAQTRTALESALAKLRYHELIYERWGFGAVDTVGRAATLCLFGAPGTGKTRAAEALAGALDMPFLAVAAGEVESRYMGDSAKNVRAIFKAAVEQGALLFFDEADSLFGRRASDVTQGVDHEVNVTKSTLLVEVERFPGVLVLATNFERNLDPAFRRRLSWVVEFVKPDAEARLALWNLHVVSGIPLAIERTAFLDGCVAASDGLTGGDILTATRLALAAAVLEEGEASRLSLDHVHAACADVRRGESNLRPTRRPVSITRELLASPADTGSDTLSHSPSEGTT